VDALRGTLVAEGLVKGGAYDTHGDVADDVRALAGLVHALP